MLLSIGGDSPGNTRRRLETLRKYGTITEEAYKLRKEIMEDTYRAYLKRESIDVRDPGDWVPLNDDGGKMRKTHIEPDLEDLV
jgi:hypothetical protein